MKNYTLPIVAVGVAALYYFSKLKIAGENLKVNLKNISLGKSGGGLSLPKIILTFEIQNVTNSSLNINGIVGDIYVNGSYLANVSNLKTMAILPKSVLTYPVEIQTSFLDAVPLIKDLLLKKGKRTIKVTGDLTLNVNDILLPYKIEKTII